MHLQSIVSVCLASIRGEGIYRQGCDVVIISHNNPIDYCRLEISRRDDITIVGGYSVPKLRSGSCISSS